MKNNIFSNLKHDIPAGIVVFLVAVPLCLGIALASGAPLFSGIIAGIVGGIVVTTFSGSNLGVSGPAAGLAAIVLAGIQDLGDYQVFLLAVVIAGAIQVVLGIARAGIVAYYFPISVIRGMLSGIGIIIFLKQIPHAFGYDKDPEGDLSFKQVDGENTFSEILNMVNDISPGATTIALISLVILILWEQKFIKRIKAAQIIQGPLVVVILGIILNSVFSGTSMDISSEHMVNIPVADDFTSFVNQFTLPDFGAFGLVEVWILGITIAIVASLETLLCVEATDKLDPQKRVTPTNRELRAQGIGNMVSGLIGGLPVTQVIVRSSANIQSGGKTKASALFHGILILISVMIIPNLLNKIPLASLAAILLVVGYKLAKPALFKQMFKAGYSEFIPYVITILAIVFTDLLKGIGIGMVVAIIYVLLKDMKNPLALFSNMKNPFVFKKAQESAQKHYRIVLPETVTFLNKAKILEKLNSIPNGTEVLIDASKTNYIQYDVLEVFSNFKDSAKDKDITLKIYRSEGLSLNEFEKSLNELVVAPEELKQMPSENDLTVV